MGFCWSLSNGEREEAFQEAWRVEEDSRKKRHRNTGGSIGLTPEKSLAQRQDSCCAELAASKITGLPWNRGVGRHGLPDLGTFVNVKMRPNKTDRNGEPFGIRFVPGKDTPRQFYSLVISVQSCHHYELIGGLWGWDILKLLEDDQVKLIDPGGKGAFCPVPRRFLLPPDELQFPELVHPPCAQVH